MDELLAYDWPGNIRELANLIEQAVIMCSGSLQWSRKLPPTCHMQPIALQVQAKAFDKNDAETLKEHLNSIERSRIIAALGQTGGRIRGADGAATLLHIKPTTLEARMRKLGISKDYKVAG